MVLIYQVSHTEKKKNLKQWHMYSVFEQVGCQNYGKMMWIKTDILDIDSHS